MRFLSLVLLSFLSLPGFALEDEDKLLKDLEQERKQQIQAAIQADKARLEMLDFAEELKKLGYETLEIASFKDDRVVRLVQKVLKQNHLKNVPRNQVMDGIMKQVKGSYWEVFLIDHPWILNALTDLMTDKEALPGLINILIRKDELKFFFYFWLGLVILSFVIRRYFFPEKLDGPMRFTMGLTLTLCLSMISVSIFYNMFKDELTPTIRIFKKNWEKS